jgi:CDP-diacylglycerol---glycerol-3-phosphate 3-phosphatidyltransferase
VSLNLPNAISAARIAAAPFLLVLPFIPSAAMRFVAFALFVFAGLTDYWDGLLARRHKMVSDLGRMLDPLADKFLLVGTIIPVYLLMRPRAHWLARFLGVEPDPYAHPFLTPLGEFDLPWWIVAIVLGREVAMTVLRTAAAKRGVIIDALASAKWKTTLLSIWIGAAYFWFFLATLAQSRHWSGVGWRVVAESVGIAGMIAMIGGVTLALYSFGVYVRRYGNVFSRQPAAR